MLIADVRFPITTGLIVEHLETELASWSPVVQVKKPDTMPRRLVTVRDDGGPDDGLKTRTRYGVNVWADTYVDAENLARDAARALRTLPGTNPFKATTAFTGPVEIEDDPPYEYSNANLTHFYFTFAAVVKGSTPN